MTTAITGYVARETFNAGSKSEHIAVALKTQAGETFKLRMAGSHPFSIYEGFNTVIGHKVSVEGHISCRTLLVSGMDDILKLSGQMLPTPRP